MWDLIVLIPDRCLSVYFVQLSSQYNVEELRARVGRPQTS